MKKMFIAALTAMAMCSYGYAQDDEDEYEEETEEVQAPVKKAAPVEEEEEEEEAPAPKAAAKSPSSGSGSGLSFGLGVGITTDYNELNAKIKLNQDMEVTAILGLQTHGATTTEAAGVSTDGTDDYTAFMIGAGFDYYLTMPLMPISAGITLAYASGGEKTVDANTTSSESDLLINIMFGVHAQLAPNLVLSGKAGFGIDYNMGELNVTNQFGQTATLETSRLDIGIKAGVYATWYFM